MQSLDERMQRVVARRQELALRWDALRNNDLLQLLVVTLPGLLRAERCGLFVLDPDADELWLEAGTGVMQRQICADLDGSMVGECVRMGTCVNRSGLEQLQGAHQQAGEELSYSVSTAMTVPIHGVDGMVVGALQVLNRLDGQSFAEADQAQLEAVAHAIQPSVQRMHASRQLQQRSLKLDRTIEVLRERLEAMRPGHSFRTFEPAHLAHAEGFLHHRWNGRCYPPFIDRRATEHLTQSWDTQPNDVLLATHQKVGTHLAKKFLVELVRANVDLPDRHPMAEGDIGHGAMPWPEVLLSQETPGEWQRFQAATSDRPRLWYLHCAVEDLPCRRIHPQTRFVVAIRDPRAALVSQYFFWVRHPLLQVDPELDMDRFAELFVEGDLYFGSYFKHVREWLTPEPRLQASQICALRYEDMVERKADTVEKLQRFLFPSASLSADRAAEIAAATEFQTMKQGITANPGSFHLNPKLYFRAGTTDNWRQHLSPYAEKLVVNAARQQWVDLEEHPLVGPYLTAMAH
ncbi:sulfotransferase domain-containing protein [Synechococcus sp. MIT S1220]|uniref:sulfotransferase domain-containing protein n=1 Tax=Synechococcus sp. MIT S1220 TaxID=3082549 RepID=UPI0039AEF944